MKIGFAIVSIFLLWLQIVASVDNGKIPCRNLESNGDCSRNGCEVDEEKGCVEKTFTLCDERKAHRIAGEGGNGNGNGKRDDVFTCVDTDHDDQPCYYFSDFELFTFSPSVEEEKGEKKMEEEEIEGERKAREGYTQCVRHCPTNYVQINNISSPTRYFCERQFCSKRVPFNNTCSLPGDNEWTSSCTIQADGTSSRCVLTSFSNVDCTGATIDTWKAWPCRVGCFLDIYQNNCSAVCDGCNRNGRCIPNTTGDDDECSGVVPDFSHEWPCGINSNCYFDDCVGRCVTCDDWGVSKGRYCQMTSDPNEELSMFWEMVMGPIKIADYETCLSRTPDFSEDFKWPCGDGDCMYDPLIRECTDVCDLSWNKYKAGDDGVCVPQVEVCNMMMRCYYDPFSEMCSDSCVWGSFHKVRTFFQPKVADQYGCCGIEPNLNDTKRPCGAENGHCYYNSDDRKCMPCGSNRWEISKICEATMKDKPW